MSDRFRQLLAGLSGGLLAVAFPGSGDQGWLAFVALVPLLAAIDGLGWRSVSSWQQGEGVGWFTEL